MRCTINFNFNSESVFMTELRRDGAIVGALRNEMGMNLAFREATGDNTKLA